MPAVWRDWLLVKRAHLTGNPTDEDLIEAAKADFEKTNGHHGIQGQRQKVESLHLLDQADTWINSWKVLRVVETYSRAAGLAASRGTAGNPPIPDNCDEDDAFVIPDDTGEAVRTPAKRKGGFQSRPVGSKACKAARTTEAALMRQSLETMNVQDKEVSLGVEKMEQAFWTGPDMRHTPEAETWRRIQAQDRLQELLARRVPREGTAAAAAAAAAPPVMASPIIDLPGLPASPPRTPAVDRGSDATPGDAPHAPPDRGAFADGAPSR